MTLAKRLSDETAAQRFERARYQGPYLRIALGGVLGGIIVLVFNAEAFAADNISLDANAIAFLTGLGVKVVYGALERAIDGAGRMLGLDGGAHREEPPRAAAVKEGAPPPAATTTG